MNSTRSQASVIDETTLLMELGLSVPRQAICRTSDARRGAANACETIPGNFVVVKVVAPPIAHKTEAGAVRFVEKNEKALRDAIRDMALRLDATEVAICELIEHDLGPGGELLLAIRWTDEFGPVVTFGAGGVAAELMSSAAILAPGIAADHDQAFAGKAFAPLVTGHRNQRARIAPAQLRELFRRCLNFAATRIPHSVTEIEINPLVPTTHGLYALDVLIAPGRPEIDIAADRPIGRIQNLLHPKSAAVMGVSSTAMNAGRVIARNLRDSGPAAPRTTIVKPGESEIDGIPCVADLASLDPVDLLVLSIAAEQIPQVIDEVIANRKAESIIVIPGGLGEHAGSETLERRLRNALAESRKTAWRGPVVNGANCLGVSTPDANTIFLPRSKFVSEGGIDAPVAIVSQSGALAATLMTRLEPHKPRYVISLGNQLDLTAGDYLQHFAADPETRVLAFYVEGFEPLDGRKWLELAARVTAGGRPVILYRAGRTADGKRATSSHTASIAGDIVVARELARAARVLFAESLDEFEDLIRLSTLLRDRRPAGQRLGAMSNAGFETVAIADHHGSLEIAALRSETKNAIAEVIAASRLDKIVTVTNPLDVNPLLGDEAFARTAELLINDVGVDSAVIGCVPLTGALGTLADEIDAEGSIVRRLVALWRKTSKPWIVVIHGGARYDAMAVRLAEAGIPVFRSADRAARALATWSATLAKP